MLADTGRLRVLQYVRFAIRTLRLHVYYISNFVSLSLHFVLGNSHMHNNSELITIIDNEA